MKTHYLIYKTTCLINNKFYIGKHKTTDLEDKYFGSGLELNKDIRKFGKEHFLFEVLIDLNNEDEMNKLERLVVNEDFIKRDDVYNLCIGGDGGNVADIANTYTREQRSIDQKNFYKNMSKEEKIIRNKKRSEGYQKFKENASKFESYCRHISETNSKKHGEETNSFGTIWLCNIELNKNKRVNKKDQKIIDQLLNNGWKIGRLKFNYKNEQSKQNSIKNLKFDCAKGTIWITDGINNKKIQKNLPIPNGWIKGCHKKKNKFKIIRIYNVETNERRKIRENEIIPTGWLLCIERNGKDKRVYINNPLTNEKRIIKDGDPIPTGFVKGFGSYNTSKNKI